MKRLLVRLFIAGAVLLLVVVVAAVGAFNHFLEHPEWIINDPLTLKLAASGKDAAHEAGYEIRWKKIHLGVSSETHFKKKLELEIGDFCLDQNPWLHGCLSEVRTAWVFDFSKILPRVSELGPTEILGGSLTASPDLIPAPKPSEKVVEKPPTFLKRVVSALVPKLVRWAFTHTVLLPLKVRVDEALVRSGKSQYRGMVDLKGETDATRKKLSLQLTARAEETSGGPKLQLGLSAEMGNLGALSPIHGKMEIRVLRLSETVPQMESKDCNFDIERSGKEGKLQLDCPILTEFSSIPKPLPPALMTAVKATLKSSNYPPDSSSEIQGEIEVKPADIHQSEFESKVSLQAKADLRLNEPYQKWKVDGDLAVHLGIPQFEAAVHDLSRTRFAVPAPFHVLKGKVDLDVGGKFDLIQARLPLSLQTRLVSKNQKFDLDGKGSLLFKPFEARPKLDLDLDLVLTSIALELPRLELGAPPQFISDPRYRTGLKTAASESSGLDFDFSLHLVSPDGSPVQILSNLAKKPIPISTDLKVGSSTPLSGSINIQSFPVEIFRRQATVDHFKLTLAEPSDESVIDGLIIVPSVDYTVKVILLATVGNPRVVMQSEPPLPENQLWAALLFGAPLEQLDPDQMNSVGATQAAVAAGAVNLASLYALASTPVQSVAYDSKTGTVSAKVKLGSGTSLNVGANANELSKVGIRNRLNSQWTIETDLDSPADSSNRTVSTYLEWSRRY